ncbi:hypothetical protein AKO1_002230 [Acrasis kona]|uniref:Uncharacterized protein n=1 Tax=Acrasis kona TaxID=1008807 RepID=A0AAW2ZRM3_9EUKA
MVKGIIDWDMTIMTPFLARTSWKQFYGLLTDFVSWYVLKEDFVVKVDLLVDTFLTNVNDTNILLDEILVVITNLNEPNLLDLVMKNLDATSFDFFLYFYQRMIELGRYSVVNILKKNKNYMFVHLLMEYRTPLAKRCALAEYYPLDVKQWTQVIERVCKGEVSVLWQLTANIKSSVNDIIALSKALHGLNITKSVPNLLRSLFKQNGIGAPELLATLQQRYKDKDLDACDSIVSTGIITNQLVGELDSSNDEKYKQFLLDAFAFRLGSQQFFDIAKKYDISFDSDKYIVSKLKNLEFQICHDIVRSGTSLGNQALHQIFLSVIKKINKKIYLPFTKKDTKTNDLKILEFCYKELAANGKAVDPRILKRKYSKLFKDTYLQWNNVYDTRVVPIASDNQCLYSSIDYGMRRGGYLRVRSEVANYIREVLKDYLGEKIESALLLNLGGLAGDLIRQMSDSVGLVGWFFINNC